jgi:hypothetical protein
MPTDPLDQPIATLIGHHIQIATRCRCARVVVFTPELMMREIGEGVTLRIAGARLRCKHCRERPALLVQRDWATGEGRDRRVDPPELPGWVMGLLGD